MYFQPLLHTVPDLQEPSLRLAYCVARAIRLGVRPHAFLSSFGPLAASALADVSRLREGLRSELRECDEGFASGSLDADSYISCINGIASIMDSLDEAESLILSVYRDIFFF